MERKLLLAAAVATILGTVLTFYIYFNSKEKALFPNKEASPASVATSTEATVTTYKNENLITSTTFKEAAPTSMDVPEEHRQAAATIPKKAEPIAAATPKEAPVSVLNAAKEPSLPTVTTLQNVKLITATTAILNAVSTASVANAKEVRLIAVTAKEAKLIARIYPSVFALPIKDMRKKLIYDKNIDFEYRDACKKIIGDAVKKASGLKHDYEYYGVVKKATDQLVSYVVERQNETVELLNQIKSFSSLTLIKIVNEGDLPAKNVKVYFSDGLIFAEKVGDKIKIIPSSEETVTLKELEQGKEKEILVWSIQDFSPSFFNDDWVRVSHDQGIANIKINRFD